MASTMTTPYTQHLLHSNHSLGYITGVTHLSHATKQPLCHLFAGLPYALPPIGPYRFRRPRSLPTCYRYGTQSNPGVFIGGAGVCPQPAFKGEMQPQTWDEDCLQCNVWVPVGEAPESGWPILFFIHGGWLQWGTPNSTNAIALLGETAFQCIIVAPAYRVNVFGFLASRELEEEGGSAGNYGFWDQRLALEWTRKFASYFGGDPTNITVGGYSAGAHSTFHQLSHDLSRPPKHRIIRRAILFSNGPGMQPKSLPDAQNQFDALLSALHIPLSLSAPEKLSRLRALPAADLIRAAASIPAHEFRATTENSFVSKTLFEDIDSGVFARKLKEARVQILIGECEAENFMYGAWRTPKVNSFDAMRKRLLADYPAASLDAALEVYCLAPERELPTFKGRRCRDWPEAFGEVYADLQVHALQRGFLQRLQMHGAGDLVKRYRIEWRAQCVDSGVPREWGVTHSTDLAIWFFGAGMKVVRDEVRREGLLEAEKKIVKRWCAPVWGWLKGEEVAWEGNGIREVRRLRSDGQVDVWYDEDWERGVGIWDVVRRAQVASEKGNAARL